MSMMAATRQVIGFMVASPSGYSGKRVACPVNFSGIPPGSDPVRPPHVDRC